MIVCALLAGIGGGWQGLRARGGWAIVRATYGCAAMKPERKDDGPVTFTDWLGITNAPRWWVARPLGVIISVALAILWVVALAAAVAVLIRSFGTADAGLGTGEAAGGAGLGAGTLIAAILGAPFLIWATVIKQKTLALSEPQTTSIGPPFGQSVT